MNKKLAKLSLPIAFVFALSFVRPLPNTPQQPVSKPVKITDNGTRQSSPSTNNQNVVKSSSSRPSVAPALDPKSPIITNSYSPSKQIAEKRNSDYIITEDGTTYPNLRYTASALDSRKTSQVPGLSGSDSEVVLSDGGVAIATPRAEKQLMDISGESGAAGILRKSSLITNDPNSSQWWQAKVGLNTAWDYGVGTKQTVLAIIDTGYALNHEEFAGRLYQNTDELGPTTQQQPSRLNCTERGIPLNKSCNVIDDNFDGIIDNEVGITTLENRSLRNCSDQSLALNKSCNMIDDDGNGLIDDVRGWDFVSYDRSTQAGETNPNGSGTTHGTQVAGVAAATGNNAKGIAGVDWYTKILPIQALDDDGYGDTLTVSRSIRYAADRGADVISISLGSTSPDSYLRQAIAYAIAKGSIVVAAAGNEGCQCLSYPARYEEVVAVGSTDTNDNPTSFSNWGDTLDVLAPGIGITSPTWASSNQNSGYSSGLAGTSFSTPLVAGLLTLSRSHQPQASTGQLIAALTEQTNRLSIASNLSRSTTLGYGRADAAAMLARVTTALQTIQRYSFGPISGGTYLAAYEPSKPFYAYSCDNNRLGTAPVYRLARAATIFYTTSEVERYQAVAQGYTSTIFGNFCINLPTDQPQIVRNLSIAAEFENRSPNK